MQAGFLHRDIKPGNFAVGRKEDKEQKVIFMLDFGLCRRFAGDVRSIILHYLSIHTLVYQDRSGLVR